MLQVVEGRVTGITGGVITGWLAGEAADGAYLEAAADGEAPFGRTRAEPGADGRLHFAIPIPAAYRDGQMRFFDVRPLGLQRPLDGGPVIFDGGLFAPAERADEAPALAEAPEQIDGLVRYDPPDRVEGWVWAPAEPSRRLVLEVLAEGRLVTTITADKAAPELVPEGMGDGRYAFSLDLSKLLRRGPHRMVIRAAGTTAALRGGRFRTGVFAPDGEVDCPGYLDDEESRGRLARLPFEHQAWDAPRVGADRLAPRLINRLRRERVTSADAKAEALLVVLPGARADAAAIWGLQSWPKTRLVDAAEGRAAVCKAAKSAGRVLFAGPEDILHPSAALIARASEAEAVAWGRFWAEEARPGSPGWVDRRPAFDPITARHGAFTDTTLALRGDLFARAPDEVLDAALAGRLNPLWFWLAGQGLSWSVHPEALTSAVATPTPPDREDLELDGPLLRRLLDKEAAPFSLERTRQDLPFPFVLVPRQRARKISVAIPFRGRADLTLRCLHALAGQRLSGELELVLVDNQSEPEEAERILSGARRLVGEERVVSLAYDAPFNHSAQNNLAAHAATGEVLVLCNNDVMLKDPAALEQLAAWAMQPGLAWVGCRLEDPGRERGSYGHIFGPASDDPFQPPLRENPDPAFSGLVHAAPGATLALAAIRRDLYLELGGLDEGGFPIGYNDVDLMLRASERGLGHLYLGHIDAEHRRGSSRTGDDEDLQALKINQAHASTIARGRLHQLVRIRIGPEPEEPPAADVACDEAELEGLRASLGARRLAELRRAELAEAALNAEALARELQSELGARAPKAD